MTKLLADLWSLVLPAALVLCATLILLSIVAERLTTWRNVPGSWCSWWSRRWARHKRATGATSVAPRSFSFSFFFALPLAPVLLLLALWLSPQTIATTTTLLVRQSPDALMMVFLAAPLALLFLWSEGSSVAHRENAVDAAKKTTGSETSDGSTALERLASRVFSKSLMRVFVASFAFCCLLSLLLDLVPTLAHLFWHQAARASLHAPSTLVPSGFVSLLGMGLLLVLVVPQLFPQPNKAIACLLLLFLPCALFFYGALCLVAVQKASSTAASVVSSPNSLFDSLFSSLFATERALNVDTLLATQGIFRPAFGWLALLCCVPYALPKATTVNKVATVFSLSLAFACLLGFVALTAAPVVSSQAWLLGEQGLNPLHAAFRSLYPNEGWLLEASLAALSATTLLALSALVRACLTLVHPNAAPSTLTMFTLALLMFVTTLGMLTGSGNEAWRASMLGFLQRTQGIGQLGQGIATLLFLAALSTIAVRSLAALRK